LYHCANGASFNAVCEMGPSRILSPFTKTVASLVADPVVLAVLLVQAKEKIISRDNRQWLRRGICLILYQDSDK
jgi:hypothetical protein